MGQTEVKFEDGEALDGSGLPVSLSNPMDISADQFWEMVEKYIRNRKPDTAGYETEYKVRDLEDGTIATESYMEASGVVAALVGDASGRTFSKILLKTPENQLVTHVYPFDPEMKEQNRFTSMYLTVHEDPVRFEYYQEMAVTRIAGPVLKHLLDKSLKDGGYTGIDVEFNVPSPSEEGKKCCLSSPLPEGTTIEKLFEMHCQQARNDDNAQDIPGGGGVLFEKEYLMVSMFFTVTMSDDGKCILHKNFGTDETLSNLQSTIHEYLLPDRRIEVFSMTEYKRVANKDQVEGFIKSVFDFAQGKEGGEK